jgi:hypothetical protein
VFEGRVQCSDDARMSVDDRRVEQLEPARRSRTGVVAIAATIVALAIFGAMAVWVAGHLVPHE